MSTCLEGGAAGRGEPLEADLAAGDVAAAVLCKMTHKFNKKCLFRNRCLCKTLHMFKLACCVIFLLGHSAKAAK